MPKLKVGLNHKVMGFRITEADDRKLRALMEATERPLAELMRTLIRLAQPTHIQQIIFLAESASEKDWDSHA